MGMFDMHTDTDDQLLYESDTTIVRRVFTEDGSSVIHKLLRKDGAIPGLQRALKREFKCLSTLSGAGTPTVMGMGMYEGISTIVMEDVNGYDLYQHPQFGQLEILDFLELGIQISEVLMEIHDAGYVHKDLNPANILYIPEREAVQIIDFGISCTFGVAQDHSFNHHNSMAGTLPYLAPEQTGRMNRVVDNRADLYSLGITLYELLTGSRPFTGTDPLELIYAHISGTPDEIELHRDDVPAGISAILQKLMAKNVEDRYQSAKGVRDDLQFCCDELVLNGDVPLFILGQTDVSPVFHIPQTLYGREDELTTLLNSYKKGVAGEKTVVAVSGQGGTGKTVLVRELFNPVTRDQGLFCSGKFDQFQHDQPHQAFLAAFRKILHWILSEEEAVLVQWREQLNTALDGVGDVLIKLLPELESIIGPQPLGPELTGGEARNRFLYAVQKFVETVSNLLNPLVIFIDDCQWMDMGSAEIFDILADANVCPELMLVCAFRALDTIGETPFRSVYHKIRKESAFKEIHLDELSRQDIRDLVQGVLPQAENSDELADIVFNKASGNPFFSIQLLLSANSDGSLFFDSSQGCWVWDTAAVTTSEIAENAVAFMQRRLERLPQESRELLHAASCLGHRFKVEELAGITATDVVDCEELLELPLQKGIIYSVSSGFFGFGHDRIQEALYSSLTEEARIEIHKKVGTILVHAFNENSSTEEIFNGVYHLNLCREQLNVEEKTSLLALNIRAAETAFCASAYNKAHEFYAMAIELSPQDQWQENYDEALALFSNGAQAAILAGEHEQCDRLCEVVSTTARDFRDTFQVRLARIKMLHARGDCSDAVALGVESLSLYGVTFPDNPAMEDVTAEIGGIIEKYGDDMEGCLKEAKLHDGDELAIMKIITEIIDASYHSAPLLLPLMICRQVRISQESGTSPESGPAFALLGLIICSGGHFELGNRLGELALCLLDRFEDKKQRALILVVVHNCILHWKRDIRESIDPLYEAYQWGLKLGDQGMAASAIHCAWYTRFFVSDPMDELAEELESTLRAIDGINQKSKRLFLVSYGQHMINLKESVAEPWRLSGHIMDETAVQEELVATGNQTGLYVLYLNRAILGYVYDHIEEAWQDIQEAEQYLHSVGGLFIVPLLYQFKSLIALRYQSLSDELTREQAVGIVADCIRVLQPMAESAPMNHGHRVKLLEAELAAVSGESADCRVLYDEAMQLTEEHGFIYDRIITGLNAGRFYGATGHRKLSGLYLAEAVNDSRNWGAQGVVHHITATYGQHILQSNRGTDWAEQTTGFTTTLTTTSSLHTLDAESLFKAIKVLSSEMNSTRIIERIIQLIRENIGAERIVLLEPEGDALLVRTNGSAEMAEILTEPVPLDECDDLPRSLLLRTVREGAPIIVETPYYDPVYRRDSYVTRARPSTIMTYPAFHMGTLRGVLYLEHSKIADLFTTERIKILEILIGQAMVLLENSKLYEQLQFHSQTLEDRVAKRTEELEQANVELERIAQIDGLTGISNRRHFDEVLANEWKRMKREAKPLSLILLDVDYFKLYNDAYGHQQGDQCLQIVAEEIMRQAKRPSDFIARYGGEEFAILLSGTDTYGAAEVAERIRGGIAALALEHKHSEVSSYVTASLGLATVVSPEGSSADTLIKQADMALYKAKRNGRNCVLNNFDV